MFFVPMFLPAVAAVIARGAAVLGRLAVGAGRAVASVGGRFGQAAGRAVQRGGVAMQRFGRPAGRGGGLRGAAQPGRPAGRQFTRQRMRGGRRGGRRQQSPSLAQAWRRAVRQGARQTVQRQRSGQVQSFFQQMLSPRSYFGRIAQNFGSAQINFRQGNTGAGLMDSAKVAGDVSKPFIAAAVALATFPKIAKEWGAALIESKRSLGEWNAAYSVATSRLDIQRMQRTRQLAGATSPSFQRLARAQNRLEDRLQPYAVAATSALLKLATLAVNVADRLIVIAETAAVVTGWAPIMKALNHWLVGEEQQPQNQPLADLAQAVARGNFQQRRRPPMPADPRPAQQ